MSSTDNTINSRVWGQEDVVSAPTADKKEVWMLRNEERFSTVLNGSPFRDNLGSTIDKKWSVKWAESRVFEPDPETGKPKKYLTAAFPYPNSPQHIGHGRTYTTTDIYARYLRLRRYNVLFPMGFHVTGTPIIAMAKRIADKDEEVLSVFERIYGIDRQTAAKLTKPEDLVMHFSKEIEHGMKEMGYSIDWRRKFYSFDAKFNKFIEWQFQKLHKAGLIVQGEHPIAWCPKDKQAVGGHDTKGDVDPEMKEYTAVKFGYKDGYLLTATLRPETIYGVTNIWINPKIVHVKAKSRKTGDIYYISKAAYEKMNYQGFELELLGEVKGSDIVNPTATAKNLITGEDVPIYAAEYVKDNTGTGIVMSVPSHAPYDHMALVDMGIHLKYKKIIKVEGYEFMAIELIQQRGITNQHDPKIEEIVKEVYKKEILTGTMLFGPYAGLKVSEAIEKTKESMFAKKQAVVFLEINGKVYCRCGAEVVASVLKNQWFIDYSKPEWKMEAKKCLEEMKIVPEKTRAEYLYAIDWFKQKACARASGLGTRFPLDKTKMIEALSDSTIYMAFYTIAHLIGDLEPEELNEQFFDYVLLGHGKEKEEWKTIKSSFDYWYPLDSRHSGADLVRNHLPFFIFNHVAIFDKKKWPRGIVTNGFVLMDGTKMSKSMGNILPLRKAIAEYGADVIRFSVVCGADLASDTDFNKSVAEGISSRLAFFSKLIAAAGKGGNSKTPTRADRWLLSRLNRKIRNAEKMYENLQLRELSLEIFYDVVSDLQIYMKRTKEPNLHDFFVKWVPLISPFIPHYAEEYWEMLGQNKGHGFVSLAKFPEVDESAISDEIEAGEELVMKVREDVENLQGILKVPKPKKVSIFVANDLKRKIYTLIAREKAFDKIMKAASADPEIKIKMDVVQKMAKSLAKTVHSLSEPMSTANELDALEGAVEFFRSEFDCEVVVQLEDTKKEQPERAKNAMPGKPAIVFE